MKTLQEIQSYPNMIIARVGVKFQAVLEPSDLGPWVPPGNAHEADFPAKVIALHEVRSFDDSSTL
jgi:hypothetical protein